ncbi:MAG: hypothetical protein H0T60_11640 [Acidobacteria bacterium]|nr:hypothetical protein [Acidobacteriota bacterium]
MVELQGEKLTRLAADIIDKGLSPVDPLIVGADTDNSGQFTVFEGNRRVTCLKLLQTPALAIGTSQEAAFAKLSKKFKVKPIKLLSCVVMPDKDSALIWIKRKHTSDAGRGIVEWNAEAQARFEAYEGAYRPSKAVLEHLKAARKLDSHVAEKLKTRTTNVDRVFQMPYLRSALGVSVAKNGEVTFDSGDKKAGNDLLVRMLQKLSTVKVDAIKSAEQRRDWIDTFAKFSVTASGDDSEEPTSKGKTARKAAKAARTKVERKTLAPSERGSTFVVTDPRLRKLYVESKELNADKFAHIASVLCRVFLELSTEHYLVTKKIPLPPAQRGKQWSSFGVTLQHKVTAALQDLDPTMKASDLQFARRGLNDPKYLHSVNELHQYVHDLKADIVGKEVRTIWDRWQPLFVRIFAELNLE